jgi:hypothetical protein
MVPAILNGRCLDLSPCRTRHQHSFHQINFIDIAFPCIIPLDHAKAEFSAVVSLETPNNPRVERLDKRGHIGFKVHEANVLQLILNAMAQEIVKCETDMPVLVAHFYVEIFDISEDRSAASRYW